MENLASVMTETGAGENDLANLYLELAEPPLTPDQEPGAMPEGQNRHGTAWGICDVFDLNFL